MIRSAISKGCYLLAFILFLVVSSNGFAQSDSTTKYKNRIGIGVSSVFPHLISPHPHLRGMRYGFLSYTRKLNDFTIAGTFYNGSVNKFTNDNPHSGKIGWMGIMAGGVDIGKEKSIAQSGLFFSYGAGLFYSHYNFSANYQKEYGILRGSIQTAGVNASFGLSYTFLKRFNLSTRFAPYVGIQKLDTRSFRQIRVGILKLPSLELFYQF